MKRKVECANYFYSTLTHQSKRASSNGANLPEDKGEIFEIPLIDGMNFVMQLIKKANVIDIGCLIGHSII